MRIKLWASTLIFGTLSLVSSWGQAAEIMDKIIATPAISVAQASYLVFVSSGKLAEDATQDQSLALLQTLGWLGPGQINRPLKAAEYAYLLTRSYALPGGILASLFPGPRYSYRDLVARGVFSAKGDPDAFLTGVEAVRILGKVMDSLPGARS